MFGREEDRVGRSSGEPASLLAWRTWCSAEVARRQRSRVARLSLPEGAGVELAALVVAFVGTTYALNTVKLRMVARARPLAAAALEGAQGFMYVYVLIRVVDGANTWAGIGAYVAGAFLGTLGAMLWQRRSVADIPGHYHACCPPVGPLPLPHGPRSEVARRTRAGRAPASAAMRGDGSVPLRSGARWTS